ncbi:perforin-1-like [Scyliorhinus canicula]|uniref:perforin-1-like n=1 Tax=Scyliorhinus canicula TaxID=7830 RepID=UPI0018F6D724|nr:perforin-1-like [Scyliorhinus canicula]
MMPDTRQQLTCFLFLSLLSGMVLSTCYTGGASECSGSPFVPGSSLAGSGYDVVTLQAKGAFVIDVNAWRHSNGSCMLCQNQLLGGARQRLPLSLVDWRVHRHCKLSLTSRLYRSTQNLLKTATSMISNSWQGDLQITPKPGVTFGLMVGGSKSKLTKFGISRAKFDSYSFTSHQFGCRYYQYRVKATPHLAPEFSKALSTLPKASHSGTNYYYRKLVNTYGTHFIKGVTLGGSFKDVTAIQTCKAMSLGYSAEEVKDCLEVEASVQMGLNVRSSAKYQRCKELTDSLKHSGSFHQAFSDRESEVTGGSARDNVDLFFSADRTAFTRWVDSLAMHPGIVRHVLEPLHHLLPPSDPRYDNLRRYISKYIMANALTQNCKKTTCPSGSYHDHREPCSCFCRGDSRVTRLCCPKELGIGNLNVKVKEGRNLWGDTFSGTDGYVVVSWGLAKRKTSVISDNNNPNWNTLLDMGEVKAGIGHELTIKVWDSDLIGDELLGTCKVTLRSGTHRKVCYLKYGKVTYDYTFTCSPHLGGSTCQDYVPRPNGPTFSSHLGPANFTVPSPILPAPAPSGEPLPSVVFP